MTAHECLLHPWLKGDHSDRTKPIDASRYNKIRDKIRAKYSNWDSFLLPIGRLSEYSSLRKMLVDKYKIYDSSFGMRRFIFCSSRSNTNTCLELFFSSFQTGGKRRHASSSNHRARSRTRARASSSHAA